MELGTVLAVCLFILCITEAIGTPYRALGFRPYAGAALYLLLLVLHAFSITITPELWLKPAALLLLLIMGFLSMRHNGYRFFLGLFLSIGIAFLSHYLFRSAMPAFEPGLWLGLIFVVFSLLLYKIPYTALFVTVASPIFFELINAGRDYLSYGYVVVGVGSSLQFDAQMAGMIASGGLLYLLIYRKSRALQ